MSEPSFSSESPTLNTANIPATQETHSTQDSSPRGSVAPRPFPADGPRFRALRPLGKGGLGEVSVALDAELNREIALKEVQARHLADPGSLARFLREAEVTGRLEHPGVVPVYSLGAHADGRPYYAMRLVRGEELQKAIDRYHRGEPTNSGERRVAFQGLLRRFVDLCNAVAYAHSRGVLHRDLKPANVMLGPFGETLVIDWGLARTSGGTDTATVGSAIVPGLHGDSGDLTQDGSVVGTPAFMSPEQALGRIAEVGPSSDVYSLGAILFALLTGKPAFPGNAMEVLANVRLGRFAPPRQVDRAVPAALEAICLKAMALQPRERYASAKDLAADVEHWMADEPVTAYREPLTERLRRWSRRHRTAVSSLGVLLLTVTVALAVGLVLVNREKDRTTAAEQQTRQALDQVTQEQQRTQLALDQVTQEQGRTQVALQRSQVAEKSAAAQRQLALETVRIVAQDIATQLKDRPTFQGLRKALLNRVLEGLERVARATDTEATADHATILARLEFGDIFLTLEAGGTEAAARQFRQALTLARKRLEREPENAEAQRDLSMSLHNVGDVQLQQGESAAALASWKESLDICRRLAKVDLNNAHAQRDLAVSLMKVGDAQMQQGESAAALASWKESREISRQLARADPANAQAQRDLAASLEKVGDVQLKQGEDAAALACYKEALDIRRQLAKGSPNPAQAQRNLAIALEKVGDVQEQQREAAAALVFWKEALDIRRRLAKADPTNAQAQRDTAVALMKVGDVQLQQREAAAALACYKETLTIFRQLARADPANAQAQRDLAVCLMRMGDVQTQQGEDNAALASFMESLDISRQLAKADPTNAQAQRDLAVALNKLGDVQLQQGAGAAALTSWKESREISRQLAKADPTNGQAQRDLLYSHFKVGNMAQVNGDFAQAIRSYEEGLAVGQRFHKPDFFDQQVRGFNELIRFCRAAEQALDDLNTLPKQPEALRRPLLVAVHKAHVLRKEHDKAVAAADLLASQARDAEDLYGAACAFALCVPLAPADEIRDKHAVRAVGLLQQALGKGFKEVNKLKTDADLNALRQRDDFRRLVRELEQKKR
jgi:serine/threonine protein kinase/Flp pilus assembly protein TadD